MNRLKELRESKNMSFRKLSEDLKRHNIYISPDALAKYERGDRNPKIDKWQALANYFNVPTSYLMGLSNDVDDENKLFRANGTMNKFKKYTDDLAEILQQKNQAYGDSFTKSVDDYGLSVIGIRLSDKYNRIHHLVTNNELKENDESLEDTLLDMAGYSILALKYLKEHKNESH